mmetsp:Transcript_25298/g.28057  ORF Transcript_25298/g.28057 Transcript_25298/m.28057 type:complete len:80 (+) Transcript_25298:80-319(+)
MDIDKFGIYERKIRKIEFEEVTNREETVKNTPKNENINTIISESDEGEESEEEVMNIQDIEELIKCKRPRKPVSPDPEY